VGAVVVERHRLGGACLHLGRPALDFHVPGTGRIGIAFLVQAADQLERQLRTLLGRQQEVSASTSVAAMTHDSR
jgi:hypothetical protein